MNIQNIDISKLKEYEKNPRKNDNAVDYVMNSIKEFGFKVPIIVGKNNVIIAGHTRYKAAKKLKLKEVPCVIADDLSEEKANAFRLADNKTSEISEWDFDLLNEELKNILDLDMNDFGFIKFNEDDAKEDFDDFEDIEEKDKLKKVICPDCGKEFYV